MTSSVKPRPIKPIDQTNPWGKLREALADLTILPYGWNGSGWLPVRPDALEYALEVFATGGPLKAFSWLYEPHASLGVDGTVLVEFYNATRYGMRALRLRFGAKDVILYKKFFEDQKTAVTGSADLDDLMDLLRWLAAP